MKRRKVIQLAQAIYFKFCKWCARYVSARETMQVALYSGLGFEFGVVGGSDPPASVRFRGGDTLPLLVCGCTTLSGLTTALPWQSRFGGNNTVVDQSGGDTILVNQI
ncbi:hypothetical protein D8674_029453 [Pyrus ussuriensis x Pyrus communis]|uniref:Uncharacterized protein n=1 Tax=Pyrus ussuriensis x Pyrus communis TaxID=2448454 RepID=A0A5N5HZ56_9ROSA|nr:hypothetical protein D8674_029453 [Pyrus ussuriensis x Pyrus communis]